MNWFLLYGNGPMANHGCEAIMLGTCAILRKTFPGIRIVHAGVGDDAGYRFPLDVHHVRMYLGTPRWSRWWWKRQFMKLFRYDYKSIESLFRKTKDFSIAAAIGGDNYTFDYGPSMADIFFSMDEELRARGIPVVHWGSSIGPFTDNPVKEAAYVAFLRSAAKILVREPVTKRYLESIGVKDNVHLIADPAFAMDPQKPEVLPEMQQYLEEPCVGVNLSPLLSRYAQLDMQRWLALACKIVENIAEISNMNVLLVPHVITEESDDHAFLVSVAQSVRRDLQRRFFVVPRSWNAPHLKWIIGQMRCFIGARTHATIAAFGMAVPTISLGYSHKARGLTEMVYGNDRWHMAIQALEVNHLGQLVAQMLADEQSLREYLGRRAVELRDLAYSAAETIKPLLQEVL